MRIIGIDPGLATIGIGCIEANGPQNVVVDEWLTIETRPALTFTDRLVEIAKDLDALLNEKEPQLAVIEKLFFATNQKTAIDVAHARGVIVHTIAKRRISIVEPTPLQLKQSITGDGQADKLQVQMMLQRLLSLSELPKPDDAADALALALYGAYSQNFAQMTS